MNAGFSSRSGKASFGELHSKVAAIVFFKMSKLSKSRKEIENEVSSSELPLKTAGRKLKAFKNKEMSEALF